MFVYNGFVYGGSLEGPIKIKEVKVLPNKIMMLTFDNGEKRVFDASILNEGVYEELDKESVFNNPRIDYGVVTWKDGAIDCAPEYMYNNSYVYEEVITV